MPVRFSGKRKSNAGGNILEIRSLLKTSLIDYPGEVCATIFTGGCNLRCPFCHNSELVLDPVALPLYPEKEVMDFLARRPGLLGGVCISGGEPTLQEDLLDFITTVKSAGFKVKLDTNGTRPRVLHDLLDRDLLDYVAADIKAPREKYNRLAGVAVDYEAVMRTVTLLRESQAGYEFRTTFVPGLLNKADIVAIAEALTGCRRYVIQRFKADAPLLDPTLGGTNIPECGEMDEVVRQCRTYVDIVELRGF